MDSALNLTQGGPIGLASVLTSLHPAHGTFTGVAWREGSPRLIGQLRYNMGERSARLAFISPDTVVPSPALPDLLDGMAMQAGEWGAFNLLAEVEENHPIFEVLRRGGYSVYAWQRIWQYQPGAVEETIPVLWTTATASDKMAIRALYQSLPPPLVQAADGAPEQPQGLVYRQEGEVLAYTACAYGARGIYLLPQVHPGVRDAALLLASLAKHLPTPLGRRIYLGVRSYQAWLEPALEGLGWLSGARQALMVKHLTTSPRMLFNRQPVLEKHRTEPTTPVVGISNQSADGLQDHRMQEMYDTKTHYG